MDFGAFMFHTDYSMPIVALAQACEASGVRLALGARALAHPAPHKSPFPGGGDVPKMYYDAMHPFVIRPPRRRPPRSSRSAPASAW